MGRQNDQLLDAIVRLLFKKAAIVYVVFCKEKRMSVSVFFHAMEHVFRIVPTSSRFAVDIYDSVCWYPYLKDLVSIWLHIHAYYNFFKVVQKPSLVFK